MTSSPVILLVEDDPSDILFLKRAFERIAVRHPLVLADTGRRAIELLSAVGAQTDRIADPAPTHILMDLKLPEQSGLEVLEWIRRESSFRTIPVSILTSSKEERDIRRAKELGVDCYFVKPMSFTMLVDMAKTIDQWVRTGDVPVASRWPPQTTTRPTP